MLTGSSKNQPESIFTHHDFKFKSKYSFDTKIETVTWHISCDADKSELGVNCKVQVDEHQEVIKNGLAISNVHKYTTLGGGPWGNIHVLCDYYNSTSGATVHDVYIDCQAGDKYIFDTENKKALKYGLYRPGEEEMLYAAFLIDCTDVSGFKPETCAMNVVCWPNKYTDNLSCSIDDHRMQSKYSELEHRPIDSSSFKKSKTTKVQSIRALKSLFSK